MSVPVIDTHVADALARLLEQYKNRPNFSALITAFAQSIQALEDAYQGIPAAFNLSGAVGVQLDALGGIIGQARDGLSDDQYRALLRGIVAQNHGDATIETLLTIIRGLFQTDSIFVKTPNSLKHTPQSATATVSIGIGDPTVPANVLAIVQQQLAQAISAGVQLNYLSQFDAADGTLAFAGKQSWVRGLSSINNPSAGGKLAALLSTGV